jgi:uncharacterized protein CbrC (UPF0167 family)
MTVHDLFLYNNYLARRDPIGNDIKPDQFNLILPVLAFEYFKKITGLPEKFRKGENVLQYGIGRDQVINDKTRYLMSEDDLTIDVNGQDTLPADYFYYESILHESSADVFTPVTILNKQKFDARNSSSINIPDSDNPICTIRNGFLQFSPIDLGDDVSTTLYYIKYPTTPYMAYAINSTTAEIVYIENGSYFFVTVAGSASDTIEAVVAPGDISIGSYTVQSGDTIDDVMQGITDDINEDYLTHGIKAIFDGDKVWLKDTTGTYTTLTINVTGSVAATKVNFSDLSTQFDWEDDYDAMNEISELLLTKTGISIRDISLTQWAELQKQNND